MMVFIFKMENQHHNVKNVESSNQESTEQIILKNVERRIEYGI